MTKLDKSNLAYNDMEDKVSNIITGDKTHEIAAEVLETIADTIGVTLGPYGYSLIIEDPTVGHYTTKDGFTGMGKMTMLGGVSGVIHNFIKEVSEKLVNKVGDGSTSSVLIAEALYKNLRSEDFLEYNIRPREVIEILEEIVESAIAHIKEIATPVSENLSELKDIATISLNNDSRMGEFIARAYQALGTTDGFINVKLGRGEKTTFECVKGFQISRGYMNKILINVPETEECVLSNPKILMFDAGLHDNKFVQILQKIAVAAHSTATNLVVIMPGAGQNIRNWMSTFHRENAHLNLPIRINFIELPNNSEDDVKSYEDLAIKVGATIVQTLDKDEDNIKWEDINNGYYGGAESVISTEHSSTFIGSKGNEAMISSRIASIKEDIRTSIEGEDVIMSSKTYRIKKRLAVMTDKLATINVGGITDQAKISDKALIDDSVAACKSAINHGYVKGGNVALILGLVNYAKTVGNNVNKRRVLCKLLTAATAAYDRVRYNANMKETGDVTVNVKAVIDLILRNEDLSDYELGKRYNSIADANVDIVNSEENKVEVINSAETDIEILKAVTSIVGLLVTSNGMITIKSKSVRM